MNTEYSAMLKQARAYLNGEDTQKDEKKAVEMLEELYEKGYMASSYFLADCLVKGIGTEKDIPRAVDILKKGGEAGDIDAQEELGIYYLEGKYIAQDIQKSEHWFGKAYEQGCFSILVLADAYIKGELVPQNEKRAFEIYSQCAEQGEPYALFRLACFYQDGIVVEKNDKLAVDLYKKAAEKGEVSAQLILGIYYVKRGLDRLYNRENAAQEYGEALKWFEMAKEAEGDPYACLQIGKIYFKGLGVDTDYKKAVENFICAAEEGKAEAMHLLALCYNEGSGIEQDTIKAIEWFTKAYKNGNEESASELAVIFITQERYDEAVFWLEKAVDMGDTEAMRVLGNWMFNGDYVAEDRIKAFELYKMGAEKENTECAYRLARCYFNGDGTEVSYDKGREWIEWAAANNNLDAMEELYFLYGEGRNGFEKNDYKALTWLKKACENDSDGVGCYLLACHYADGQVFKRDDEAAFYWFSESVKRGFDYAWLRLAECYARGIGTEFDPQKAKECLDKAIELNIDGYESYKILIESHLEDGKNSSEDIESRLDFCIKHLREDPDRYVAEIENFAEKGHAGSIAFLSELFRQGIEDDVPVNIQKANYWLEKSASNNEEWAVLKLYMNYRNGKEGFTKDINKAIYWIENLLKNVPDNVTAQTLMGLAYVDGEGVPRNTDKGIALIRKAAEAGGAYAQDRLGAIYHNGLGMGRRDLKMAEYWLSKALDNGWKESQAELDQVRSEINSGSGTVYYGNDAWDRLKF